MNGERWRRIEELYHAARLLKDSARASFLAAATEGDEELRREVESLLVSGASSPGFLDEPLQTAGATALLSDASSLSGRRIGTYSVHERIGTGGMGEVYRAHDSKLHRDVAFKVLAAGLMGEHDQQRQDHLRRFRHEAHALAALNHPNIAAIYGLEETDGVTALVMELVDGSTLADRIMHGAVPLEEALPIAKQIADAMEAAHERGIVHRDLKPANIKLRSDGTVKVLDFGLAKAVGPAAGPLRDVAQQETTTTPAMTATGIIVGTAAYMSPEQAAGKAVDHRADIWAFGCVLFEMLTGRAAFGSDTLTDTLAAVMRAEPEWSRVPVGVTDPLRELIRRCLRKDPRQRLQAIGDARIALEEVLSGVASPALSARRRSGRTAWIVAGVAMLATIALATGFYIVSRRGEAPPLHLSMTLPQGWDLALSSSLGEPTPLVVSPNGRRVAIVARQGDGPTTILMRELASSSARPLAGTEGATSLFWSPDNRFIGFFADGKIKKLDVSGGVPTVLCDATTPFGGGTWGREGTIVFSMLDRENYRLWKVADSGGQPTDALSDAPASQKPNDHEIRPWFLPDGRTILYVLIAAGRKPTVYLGRLDSPDRVKVVETDSTNVQYANGYLLFLRGATLVAQPFDEKRLALTGTPVPVAEHVERHGAIPGYRLFSASQNGVLAYKVETQAATLAWVDRQGQTLGTIGEPVNYQAIALSHDETRVVAIIGTPRNLFLVDLSNGVRTQFTFDQGGFPVWSHDDRFIDFAANFLLYRKPSNGAGASERLLPNEKSPALLFDRGGDDSMLVMIPRDHPGADLTVVPGSGDRTPFRLASTPQDKRIAKFSPDARWVAYVSNESGSVQNVWVVPVVRRTGAGDVKYLISGGNGGTLPQWSADGHELFYISSSETLTAVQVNGNGEAFQVGPANPLFPIRVSQAEGGYNGWHYAVSRDGRRFLVIVSSEAPVSIEVNWTARLKG
jgi:serine/threonine protein kinase/Tol biopolymer transport system component